MVRCVTCNNNGCNGNYGTVNGKDCPDCAEAYDHQSAYLKNESSVRFAKFEKKKLTLSEDNKPDRDKVLAMLLRLTVKHERIIAAIAEGLFDVSKVVKPLLEPCSNVECTTTATVCHKLLGIKFCDYHCAKTIIGARSSENIVFSEIKDSIGNEDYWIDVEGAESIRHICDYLEITKNLEESIITPSRMH